MSPQVQPSRSPQPPEVGVDPASPRARSPGARACGFVLGVPLPVTAASPGLSLVSLYSFVSHHLTAACCLELIDLKGYLCFI